MMSLSAYSCLLYEYCSMRDIVFPVIETTDACIRFGCKKKACDDDRAHLPEYRP